MARNPPVLLPLAAWLAVAPLAAAQAPGQAAPCGPHCTVRPGQFGYYATHWRRWPEQQPAAAAAPDSGVPVPPARSAVPRPDEESPRREGEEPATAIVPGVVPAGGTDEPMPVRPVRPTESLVAEAVAMRRADAGRRQEFTMRLVSAMLAEPDPLARCGLLSVAAEFETAAAEAICAGALDDPDPRVRRLACQVCAARGGADGIARLVRRARDDADLGVRLRAVRSLGDLGDPAAIPHLVAFLDDPDPAVQARAVAALTRSTGRDLGADPERWRAWAANPEDLPPPRSLGATLRGLVGLEARPVPADQAARPRPPAAAGP